MPAASHGMAARPDGPEATPPNVIVRVAADGTPFYEAKWRVKLPGRRTPKQMKRRLGAAWVVPDDEGGWRKRPGRPGPDWLDERAAYVAAAEKVREHLEEEAAGHRTELDRLTVRELSHEWHEWLSTDRDASPAVVRDYRYLIREPGEQPRRGNKPATGRIMKAFGNHLVAQVEPGDVSAWLRKLSRDGLTPRNVNKHREVLHSIFNYARRDDTYKLAANPVSATDKRRVPPPAKLDYYEPDEVELLARTAAKGPHRKAPNYKGRPERLSDAEVQLRIQQDEQDADLFRVLLYSGLRLGEARALRWRDIVLTEALDGGVLDVRNAFSADVEKPPKSWKPRTVPIPHPAAKALARLATRPHFTTPDDFVFCSRTGKPLDTSSIRRRYKAARAAAGLREVKLHGLRHSAGSIIAQGAGLLVARDVLGHAHVSTTNRYLAGKTDHRAIAVMNAAYAAAEPTPVADE